MKDYYCVYKTDYQIIGGSWYTDGWSSYYPNISLTNDSKYDSFISEGFVEKHVINSNGETKNFLFRATDNSGPSSRYKEFEYILPKSITPKYFYPDSHDGSNIILKGILSLDIDIEVNYYMNIKTFLRFVVSNKLLNGHILCDDVIIVKKNKRYYIEEKV